MILKILNQIGLYSKTLAKYTGIASLLLSLGLPCYSDSNPVNYAARAGMAGAFGGWLVSFGIPYENGQTNPYQFAGALGGAAIGTISGLYWFFRQQSREATSFQDLEGNFRDFPSEITPISAQATFHPVRPTLPLENVIIVEPNPSNVESFVTKHRLKEVHSDRRIKVYSTQSHLEGENLEQAKLIAEQLNSSFSLEEDECFICKEDWKDLKTDDGQLILSKNDCACPRFYCVGCSSALKAKACPNCRKENFHRDLIFVVTEDSEEIANNEDETETVQEGAKGIDLPAIQVPEAAICVDSYLNNGS